MLATLVFIDIFTDIDTMSAFAFVFPGQGSQSVGMLDAWGDNAAVAETLAEASEALHEDVARLIHEGPKEALALTANTQPVMLAAGVACWQIVSPVLLMPPRSFLYPRHYTILRAAACGPSLFFKKTACGHRPCLVQ